MEIKTTVKRGAVVFVILALAFILQTSIFSHFALAGVVPNILLSVTSIFGFSRGQKSGIVIGFISGLMIDIFGGFYLGYFALCFMLIGYLNGFFKKVFYGDDIVLPMILVSSSSLCLGFINFFVFLIKNERYDFYSYFTSVMMPETVYTLIVSVFVYYAIISYEKWSDGLEKRSSNSLV